MKISKTAVIATVVFIGVSAFCIVGKTSSPKIQYKDGTYNVTVQGRNAPIELEMVVSKGKPFAVNVLSQEESFFAQPAEEKIINLFVGGKPLEKIDAVSGATITSTAMKEGLQALVDQAVQQ